MQCLWQHEYKEGLRTLRTSVDKKKTMASLLEESCSSNPREGDGQHMKHKAERKQVYRIPRNEEEQNPLIYKPAEWIIQLLVFQVKIIIQAFTAISRALDYCYSVVAELVHRTVQAKDRATEVVCQKLAMISQVPSKVTEGGGIMMRKLKFGCLAATSVGIILVGLMFAALILGIIFVRLWVEEPVIIRQALYFDYTQPHPSAIVSFIPSNNIQAGVSQLQRFSGRRIIPVGHRFSVTVILVTPESDYNRQIGMFQLTAEIISTGDKILARSSQPCMLRFMSTPVRLAKTFLMGLPLLMGILAETQTIIVHLIDYQEKKAPTESIKIRLQPKSGTTGLPELYSAEVDIHSQLPRIKELARNWKWTIYVWSTVTFYCLLMGLVICCYKQMSLPRAMTTGRTNQENLREGAEDLRSALTDSGLSEQSRRHGGSTSRRQVSFAQESPTSAST